MSKCPRSLRIAFAGIATIILAVGILGLGPVATASAATATYISLHSTVATPTAGGQVTMQVFTGSLDGSYPAGGVDLSVEGTGMIVGGPVNTGNGGATIGVGIFPIGTITVDATFTPTNSATYTPISTKATVTIVGAGSTIHPLFPTAPTLGHAVTVSTILTLDSGDTRAPGGVIGYSVGGVTLATCTPAPTGTSIDWSCAATLPAPSAAGPYTVTASFGRSSYYMAASGSTTVTIAAATVTAAKPKAAAPVTTSNAAASTPAGRCSGRRAALVAPAQRR
jgi:hypothetical protein